MLFKSQIVPHFKMPTANRVIRLLCFLYVNNYIFKTSETKIVILVQTIISIDSNSVNFLLVNRIFCYHGLFLNFKLSLEL